MRFAAYVSSFDGPDADGGEPGLLAVPGWVSYGFKGLLRPNADGRFE